MKTSGSTSAVYLTVPAREFAGQKVKVTGRITGKAIRVSAIEAVS